MIDMLGRSDKFVSHIYYPPRLPSKHQGLVQFFPAHYALNLAHNLTDFYFYIASLPSAKTHKNITEA